MVIGRFRGLQGFEASGVIGAEDALAMYNLHEYFKRIGFGSFNVSYNDQLATEEEPTSAPGRLIWHGTGYP